MPDCDSGSDWLSFLFLFSCCHVLYFVAPWTVALQSPLSMGFSRQEYWSGLPCPSIGDLSDPGTEPTSPVLADKFFTAKPPNASEITLLPEHHLSAVWG